MVFDLHSVTVADQADRLSTSCKYHLHEQKGRLIYQPLPAFHPAKLSPACDFCLRDRFAWIYTLCRGLGILLRLPTR